MAKLIDGKQISQEIKDEVKAEALRLWETGRQVTLAVIQVGEDPASTVYVGNKKKACDYVGFRSLSYELPEDTTEVELLSLVNELNDREDVDGILVQLPLPKHLNEDTVIAAIAPEKDVDGFHAVNTGNLWIGKECFVSCTPAGIIELLKRSDISMEGKECVVVGRSNIVGKPMAGLMLKENATVTICHSKTKELKEITKRADILIVAIGKPQYITAEYAGLNTQRTAIGGAEVVGNGTSVKQQTAAVDVKRTTGSGGSIAGDHGVAESVALGIDVEGTAIIE